MKKLSATDMMALAVVIETGDPVGRRPTLLSAANAVYGPYRIGWPGRSFYRFSDLLNAEAYTEAALMLLPDGWVIGEMSWWPHADSATVHMDNMAELTACSGSTVLAYAIAAACVRAHAQGRDDD